MGTTVQVRGSLETPAFDNLRRVGLTLCLLAPIALGLREFGLPPGRGLMHLVVRVLEAVGPVILLAAGVACLLAAMGLRGKLRRGRVDLEVGEAGFALIDRDGRREIRDDQVTDIGLETRSSPRRPGRSRGRASIGVDDRDGPGTVGLDWRYGDDEGDPLSGLMGRLLRRLEALAERSIDSGGRVEGEGWELSRSGLQLGRGLDLLPIEEVAHAEYHDGELQIWRRGEARPIRRVPRGSRNVEILRSILEARKPAGPAPEGPGLGRILAERGPTLVERLVFWRHCAILAGIAIVMFLVPVGPRGGKDFAAALILLILLPGLPSLFRQFSVFRFHERGVCRSGLLGSRELPFADLDRVDAEGVPGAGLVKFTFRPIEGRGRERIVLRLKPTDEALKNLEGWLPGQSRVAG